MSIAEELEVHAGEELQHALTIAKQIDYLGGMPTATPKSVKISDKARTMLRFDLDNENETIRNYRERVRAVRGARRVRDGRRHPRDSRQEQEHQIDLATALGMDVPDVSKVSAWHVNAASDRASEWAD